VEGGGKQKRDRTDGADPGQHADKRTHKHTDETVEKVHWREAGGEAADDAGKDVHSKPRKLEQPLREPDAEQAGEEQVRKKRGEERCADRALPRLSFRQPEETGEREKRGDNKPESGHEERIKEEYNEHSEDGPRPSADDCGQRLFTLGGEERLSDCPEGEENKQGSSTEGDQSWSRRGRCSYTEAQGRDTKKRSDQNEK